MDNRNPPASPDVWAIMARVLDKSRLIAAQCVKRDAGQFQSIGAAIGLQRLQKEAAQLRKTLPPLRLVS